MIRLLRRKHIMRQNTFTLILLLVMGYSLSIFAAQSHDIKLDLSKKDRKKLVTLMSSNEWKNFRQFWKELLHVREDEINKANGFVQISDEHAIDLRQKQKIAISELKNLQQKGIIAPFYVDLLEKISSRRIKHMRSGIIHDMKPRAIWYFKQYNFEKEIYKNIVLLKEKKISEDEFKKNIENINKEINDYHIRDFMGIYYDTFFEYIPNPGPAPDADFYDGEIGEHIQQIENDFAQPSEKREEESPYYKDFHLKSEQIRREVEELKKILPPFAELLADLARD